MASSMSIESLADKDPSPLCIPLSADYNLLDELKVEDRPSFRHIVQCNVGGKLKSIYINRSPGFLGIAVPDRLAIGSEVVRCYSMGSEEEIGVFLDCLSTCDITTLDRIGLSKAVVTTPTVKITIPTDDGGSVCEPLDFGYKEFKGVGRPGHMKSDIGLDALAYIGWEGQF